MAMTLREYYEIRCAETFEGLRNMRAVFDDLCARIQDAQLSTVTRRQYETIEADLHAFAGITGMTVPAHGEISTLEGDGASSERLVIVGRTWTGTLGRGMVEHYRVFVEQIPPYLTDVNAAMLAMEVCHFNLGNDTGLIVLAKELGLPEDAMRLQGCIDRQTALRVQLESSLWQIVAAARHQEMHRAA